MEREVSNLLSGYEILRSICEDALTAPTSYLVDEANEQIAARVREQFTAEQLDILVPLVVRIGCLSTISSWLSCIMRWLHEHEVSNATIEETVGRHCPGWTVHYSDNEIEVRGPYYAALRESDKKFAERLMPKDGISRR
jgi:hypothetical protein